MPVVGPTIAILSPTPTHPTDFGNRKRLYQICSGLQRRGALIHFIYYPLEFDWRERCPHSELQAMRNCWDAFEIVVPTIPIHLPAKGEDHYIDEWWDPSLESFLSWYFSSYPIDAFIVNYVYLSKAFLSCREGCMKVLDTHDILANRRQKLAEIGIGREFFHTTTEEENIGLSRSELIIAIKDQEEREFRQRVSRQTLTIPYCEPPRVFAPHTHREGELVRFGYLGARNSMNLYNLRRFLDVALPIWHSYMAPLELVIAGTVCDLLDDLADVDGIRLIGRVESVEEFYESVHAVVVPMEVSTGQKIKSGEALGYGVPVIAHSHSFEGYATVSSLHRCQSFEEMARSCMEVAFNPQTLQRLRAQSIEAQQTQLHVSNGALDQLYTKIVSDKALNLIVLDAENLIHDSLYALHVGAIIQLAAAISRTYIFIRGRCDRRHSNFLDVIGALCRVFAEEVGDVAEPTRVQELTSAASLLDLGYSVKRIWPYAEINYRPFLNEDVEVIDAGIFGTFSASLSQPEILCGSGLPYRIGRFRTNYDNLYFEPAMITAGAAFDHLPRPVQAQRNFFKGRSTIWVVACEENVELAGLVGKLLIEMLSENKVTIIQDRGIDNFNKMHLNGNNWVTLSDLLSGATGLRPHWAIDLTTEGSRASALIYYLRHRNIAVLQPEDQNFGMSSVDIFKLTNLLYKIVSNHASPHQVAQDCNPRQSFRPNFTALYNALSQDEAMFFP